MGSDLQSMDIIRALNNSLRVNLLKQLTLGDLRVQELCNQTCAPINLVSYHLKKLKEAGLVRERRSMADGRDLYYSLELQTLQSQFLSLGFRLHPSLCIDRSCLPRAILPFPRSLSVLFLCTHNSARSQIAEAILRVRSEESIEVFSAGTHPTEVHPLTFQVLKSRGFPIEQIYSKHLNEVSIKSFDVVITVCDRAREECPVFQGTTHQLHWSLPDPLEVLGPTSKQTHVFEKVARELEWRIDSFLINMQAEFLE